MIEIISEGLVESEDQIMELTIKFRSVVVPREDAFGDVEMSHWWQIREDGEDMLYVGNQETFARYVLEMNGVQ